MNGKLSEFVCNKRNYKILMKYTFLVFTSPDGRKLNEELIITYIKLLIRMRRVRMNVSTCQQTSNLINKFCFWFFLVIKFRFSICVRVFAIYRAVMLDLTFQKITNIAKLDVNLVPRHADIILHVQSHWSKVKIRKINNLVNVMIMEVILLSKYISAIETIHFNYFVNTHIVMITYCMSRELKLVIKSMRLVILLYLEKWILYCRLHNCFTQLLYENE